MTTPAPTAAKPRPAAAPGSPVMRALFKHRAGPGLELDAARPVPAPGARDVLIRVTKAGICGTDRHIWEWDAWAAAR
ncbi:MAG: hypothetical protein ACK4WH_13240, partial [Phycisphaerales bacterium]